MSKQAITHLEKMFFAFITFPFFQHDFLPGSMPFPSSLQPLRQRDEGVRTRRQNETIVNPK
jgi:hypothetical protein